MAPKKVRAVSLKHNRKGKISIKRKMRDVQKGVSKNKR